MFPGQGKKSPGFNPRQNYINSGDSKFYFLSKAEEKPKKKVVFLHPAAGVALSVPRQPP
jgi:hypothetical protein